MRIIYIVVNFIVGTCENEKKKVLKDDMVESVSFLITNREIYLEFNNIFLSDPFFADQYMNLIEICMMMTH